MKFEEIKKVKLLVSLKGTEEGKQMVWLRGTVLDKEIRPFSSTIIKELSSGRPRIFGILETYPEPEDKIVKEETKIEEKQETPKEVSPKLKTRVKRKAI